MTIRETAISPAGEADCSDWFTARGCPHGYTSYWERQANLYAYPANSGVYEVSAYIRTTGILYDCYSSPDLVTDIYLY